VVSIILWSRVQAPAGPPDKKTNPSSGWSFFTYSRVLARVRAGSCGLRRFPRVPGLGRFHSLLAILLSGLAVCWRPKSTSSRNFIYMNQQLIRGPFKRLIGGIGRRWKQQRYCSERTTLKVLLLSDLVLVCYRAWAHPVGEVAHRPLLRLAGCRIWMSANSSHVPPMETHRTRTRLLL